MRSRSKYPWMTKKTITLVGIGIAAVVLCVFGATGAFSPQEPDSAPSSTVEAQETRKQPVEPGSAPVDAEEIISNIPREQIESDLLQGQTQYLKTCDGLVTVGMALAEAPPIYNELETALDELWIAYDCKA